MSDNLVTSENISCANNINGCFVGTACPVDDDTLGVDFFLCVKGGASKKNVVWAVEEYGSDLIEGIPAFAIEKLSGV